MGFEHNYMQDTKETSAQVKAWRTGGLRLVLGLLVKEYGIKKVKTDLDLIIAQNKTHELNNIFK